VLDAFAACDPFRELSGTLYRETFWLVSDQLGTPRMVADKSGSLAGIKRHDYLPFGEELYASAGGRMLEQGYKGNVDDNRKRWAQLERDYETGLDYAQARYYLNKQGRFTSPDEFTGGPDELFDFVDVAAANPTFYADLTNPQSLNKYQYTYNNPLRYTDPSGHCTGGAAVLCAEGVVAVGGSVAGPVGAGLAGLGFTIYVVVDRTVGWDKVIKNIGANDPDCPQCQMYGEKAFGRFGSKANSAESNAQPAPSAATQSTQQAQSQARPGPTEARGNRDQRKVNQGRADAAKAAADAARAERDRLRSLPNKTPEDKEALKKAERELQRQLDRMRKSESHGRKGKGN
jgi:RHS repeat-associated protein